MVPGMVPGMVRGGAGAEWDAWMPRRGSVIVQAAAVVGRVYH